MPLCLTNLAQKIKLNLLFFFLLIKNCGNFFLEKYSTLDIFLVKKIFFLNPNFSK